MVKRIVFVVVLLGAAGAGVWLATRPAPARAHLVARRDVVALVMGTGTLEARTEVTIASKIAGRVAALTVDQGDTVQAGMTLLELDDADIRRQVEVAVANHSAEAAAVARAQADSTKAGVILAAARREHDRVLGLLGRSMVSQSDADRAFDEVHVATAGLEVARSALLEAQRRKEASERSREFQQARLAETVVRAPFDGLVVRRHREVGDVLAPGSAVLTLVVTRELWVRAWVDETEMARLSEGQTARVLFRSVPDQTFTGVVARLGKEVDRESREFIVDVAVQELPENWAIGQRAEVYIEVERADTVLALPVGLVHQQNGRSGVFVLVEGRAQWTEVDLGVRGQDAQEIISGLAEGAEVLEPSGGPLSDGQAVAVP